MGDADAYWRWREELLRHPDGRAKGGEPCVRCGSPIPSNAHWVQRDHHVCSGRCNLNLARWFSRQRDAGKLLTESVPYENPRQAPKPATFRTGNPTEPYEFSGYGPLDGDTVERHGSVTSYTVLHASEDLVLPEYAPHGLFIASHVPSGFSQIWAADPYGDRDNLLAAEVDPGGKRLPFRSSWSHDGLDYMWQQEVIDDVTREQRPYQWRAVVAVAVGAGHRHRMATEAFARFAAARARTTASVGRHARRVRLANATVERFDPVDIYDRDGWLCRLCGQAIDPDLAWPDFYSASLDHVIPLAANGEHSRDNTQAAHWICNVRKGARTSDVASGAPGQLGGGPP